MKLSPMVAIRLISLVLLIALFFFLANSSSCDVLADCRDEEYSGDIHSEYESAWVLDIDYEQRLVHVQTVDSKVNLVFRVDKEEDIRCFRKGNPVPVTFGPISQVFIRKKARKNSVYYCR